MSSLNFKDFKVGCMANGRIILENDFDSIFQFLSNVGGFGVLRVSLCVDRGGELKKLCVILVNRSMGSWFIKRNNPNLEK